MTEILTGDCRALLPLLPSGSIQCCVTSPPYYGLRDYGVADQLGLEPTPEMYVEHLVAVLREVRRALRADGTLWLNLGDSYAGSSTLGRNDAGRNFTGGGGNREGSGNPGRQGAHPRKTSLKDKDLIGVPWRVAFALQADGWYLRSDIVWAKGNPMPESVRDRPTRAHEYLFLLTKSPRYFYDQDAIREPHTSLASPPGNKAAAIKGRLTESYGRPDPGASFHPLGRNKRSWWPINTRPYKGAHFATFPPDLVRPCLLAGTSAHGACVTCGTPYRRVLEKGEPDRDWQRSCGGDEHGEYHGLRTKDYAAARAQDASAVKARILANMRSVRTAGWSPGCRCRSPVRPCWVLDPFAGSGTVAVVAQELGMNALLLELNPDYAALAKARLEVPCPSSTSAKTRRSPSAPRTTSTKLTGEP